MLRKSYRLHGSPGGASVINAYGPVRSSVPTYLEMLNIKILSLDIFTISELFIAIDNIYCQIFYQIGCEKAAEMVALVMDS